MALRIGGEGARPAALMIIGEMPGLDEGRQGRPFAGKSGRELRRYLNGFDLPHAADCYLTNYSKTVAPTVRDMRVTDADRAWLYNEITAVQPRVILTAGASITDYLIQNGQSLDALHGIPHPIAAPHHAALGALRPQILPGYNPAAMLHSPKLQSTFAYDMRRLSLLLAHRLPAATIDDLDGRYALASPAAPPDLPARIGVDTEGWTRAPWCIGWSGARGVGEVVRFGQHQGWVQAVIAQRARTCLVIHSALHDLPVLRACGLDVVAHDIAFDDTMVMAYLLGLEPQGLKALAYRHAGMTMQDYSDITAEAAGFNAFQWLLDLHDRLPDAPRRLTARAAATCATAYCDADRQWWSAPPLPEADDGDKATAKRLIAALLQRHGASPELPRKWADGRAREILVEELQYLADDDREADPPEPTLDEIDPQVAVQYAGRDPDATLRIWAPLDAQITALGLRAVYDADMAIIPMIDRMQTVGLGVDVAHYHAYAAVLAAEEQENREAIADLVGIALNPNSGDQVAALLYDRLQVQAAVPTLRLKKTAAGRFSTNDKTLDALRHTHPVVPLIQDGREIRKLRTTYCETIPRLVGRDGRLHPQYRITRTETGRLSASAPNVLALPKHSARGQRIREGIVAAPGHELGEWDLSQIEMCMFAHDSGDPVLIAAITRGQDLHYDTAARVIQGLTVPASADTAWYAARVTKAERFAAKAVNFGILMGITPFGLLDQLHKNGQLQWQLEADVSHPSAPDTTTLLQTWKRTYAVAWDYIQARHAEARRYGCVRDYWGRLRWLEGIRSSDDYIRAEAERMAQATPTQSGAQGIMKRIMGAAWPVLCALRQSGIWVEPLLQIHDALLLEYTATARDLIDGVMMPLLTTTVQIRVPIRAAAAFGTRLSDLSD